jgi:Flp pilus assembly protein TadB
MVHEVSRTKELAERRRAHSADHAGLEVKENRAWYVPAARGLVVKHIDVVELRVVVAAVLIVLAVAADAMLVAQHLLKLVAHLVTALARLHVLNLARRSSLEAGSTREKKGGE